MKLEFYKPAFYVTLSLLFGFIYYDYQQDRTTEAKVVRLAGQMERFNSENWRHIVPVVKEATMELRLFLGIELPGDAAAKLKAEAEAKTKAEAERKTAENTAAQVEMQEKIAQVIGAIQLAVAPLPKQFEIAKADPLSISAEYAKMIEEKVHEIYPNCTETQCAAICVSARSYLAARGDGLADDVIENILEGYHSEDDCPADQQEDDSGDRDGPE